MALLARPRKFSLFEPREMIVWPSEAKAREPYDEDTHEVTSFGIMESNDSCGQASADTLE